MKNVKVVMSEITTPRNDYPRYELNVFVDGELIGGGGYGGEPEDNTHYRDYKWVQELVVELAKELGAEVTQSAEKVKSNW